MGNQAHEFLRHVYRTALNPECTVGREENDLARRSTVFWSLNILFLLQWAALGLNVYSRSAWLLENLLVVIFVIPVVMAYRANYLSQTSYFLIFIFASLHNLGAHYTYSLVPYEHWIESTTGIALRSAFGWSRNHYDRIIHFLFGLLLFLPLEEFVNHVTSLKRRWVGSIVVLIVTSFSTAYELLEWFAAVIFSEGAGPDYVGTQGDVWDAQKDQALAIFGVVLAWILRSIYCHMRNRKHVTGWDRSH